METVPRISTPLSQSCPDVTRNTSITHSNCHQRDPHLLLVPRGRVNRASPTSSVTSNGTSIYMTPPSRINTLELSQGGDACGESAALLLSLIPNCRADFSRVESATDIDTSEYMLAESAVQTDPVRLVPTDHRPSAATALTSTQDTDKPEGIILNFTAFWNPTQIWSVQQTIGHLIRRGNASCIGSRSETYRPARHYGHSMLIPDSPQDESPSDPGSARTFLVSKAYKPTRCVNLKDRRSEVFGTADASGNPTETTRHHSEDLLHTCILALAYMAVGMCTSILGPTLLELSVLVECQYPWILVLPCCRAAAELLGAVALGSLLERLSPLVALSCCLVLAAMGTLLVPYCYTAVSMATAFILQGMALGYLDGGMCSLCIFMWTGGYVHYLLGLHVAFGLGTVIGPLTAKQFLSVTSQRLNSSVMAFNDTLGPVGNAELQGAAAITNATVRYVRWPYILTATWMLLIAVVAILAWLVASLETSGPYDDINKPKPRKSLLYHGMTTKCLVICMVTIQGLASGNVATYQLLLFMRAVESLGWPPSHGAYLTAVYNAAMLVASTLPVYFIRFIQLETLLVINITVAIITLALQLTYSTYHVVLWVCATVLGICMGLLLPCLRACWESRLSWCSRLSGLLMTTSHVGMIVLPVLAGVLMLQQGGHMFEVILLVSMAAVAVLMLIVACLLFLEPGDIQCLVSSLSAEQRGTSPGRYGEGHSLISPPATACRTRFSIDLATDTPAKEKKRATLARGRCYTISTLPSGEIPRLEYFDTTAESFRYE